MIKLKVDENQPIILKVDDSTTATMSVEESIVAGGAANLQTKSVSVNPSESIYVERVLPGAGYDGMDEVDITVVPVSSTYVGSMIPRNDSTDLTVNGNTVTAPAGYYENNATKTVSSNDFIITLTYNSVTSMYEPDVSYAEIDAAHTAGKNLVLALNVQYPHLYSCGGWYNTEEWDEYDYWVEELVEVSVNPIRYGYESVSYKYDANGLTVIGSGIFYDTTDADAVASQVKSGQVFYTSTGRAVGAATARTSSDLSASGGTVTAPAGFYASAATYTFPNANGEDF